MTKPAGIPDFLMSALRPARRLALRILDRKGLRRANSRLRQIARMKQELVPSMEVRIDQAGQVFLHEPMDSLDYFFPLHAADPSKIGNYTGFEMRERALVCAALVEGSAMIDVGANVGVFSLSAARAKQNIKIFAMEPVRDNFEVCRINLARNGLTDRISLHHIALGEAHAMVEIPTGVGTWQFISSAAEKSHSAGMAVEQVQQLRLDDFVKENIHVPISMIKCDVEGYELFVLKGAKETIRAHRPAMLLEISAAFCTRFKYRPEEIFQLLEPFDYSYIQLLEGASTRIGELTDRDVNFNGSNCFFVPKERLAEFRKFLGL